MHRLKILTFMIWWAAVGSMAQDSLRIRLDSLLADPMFETSQVGLMVYDLTADSALYCHGERQLLRPASTMKLVTAITALDKLGGSYYYSTRVYYTGRVCDSLLVGDIYCVGGFDPMLTTADVRALAESISQMGIDSISGTLWFDRTMKEPLDYGEGWCWDDDNPLLTALSVGRKDVFAEQFCRALQEQGIKLGGLRTAEGRLPAKGVRLLGTASHSINQVLQRMMKESDNFFAESMFYQTAAATGNRPAKAADARTLTRRLISRLGLGGQPYKIADGSGLSLYNYVSAELLVRLLRYASQQPGIYDHLLPALPIAGMDGTLKKRMTNGPACGNVRAKTGTLTGISSLAGYCEAANGHQLCFAIINQGVMRNADGRAFQDRVCTVLCQP